VLKLCDRADDLKEQTADGGRRVDPLIKHDQVDTAGLEDLGELDQVLERPAKPVEFGHHELIADPVHRQQRPIEFRALRELPGRRVDEDLFAPRGAEGVVLGLGVLIAG
jgi:hypothetical protein